MIKARRGDAVAGPSIIAPVKETSDSRPPAARASQLALDLPAPAPAATADELPFLQVRRHPRARRLSIRVHPGGRTVVVVPRRTAPAAVAAFIHEHREWILRTVAQLRPAGPPGLPERVELQAIARRVEVSVGPLPARTRWLEQDARLVLPEQAMDEGRMLRRLQDWLLVQARREGPALVDQVSVETGLVPTGLQFRLQRTRWGSCSSRGTLSLNACLLFLPPSLWRYLVLHELCHLRHMNHSRRFWQLVGQFEPDYRALDRALDQAWRQVPGWVFGERG